jgi:hypothetical protein
MTVSALVLSITLLAAPPTLELSVGKQKLVGRALSWSDDRIYLLAQDGRVWDFEPSAAKNARQSASPFRPLTKNELRAELSREFGAAFDVTSTGNYLVVHPAGQRDQWAERFEQLYRSFLHYFSVRGFQPRNPSFPLVAIVFARQEDYLRYAAAEGQRISPQVVGYYSPQTNRIAMYDMTAGQKSADWTQNAETLIHEAAHQTAFNTGVHSRWSSPPRWVAEGLGTMFEAKGVWDSSRFASQPDRINRYRLEAFQRYAAGRRKKGALAEMVASDRFFQRDPDGAYAEAWAVTFYLAENEPRNYMAYLLKTGQHAPFAVVKSPQRLQEFTDVFGPQLDLIEAKMLRFIGELK